MREFILTSKSPRRKTILEDHGYEFRIFPIEISEILNKNLNLPDQISDCAKQKVEAALKDPKLPKSGSFLLLAADTLVIHNGEPLGKPKNEQDAFLILNQLSGQVHEVITGFCLFDLTTKRFILGHETTEVRFKKLNDKQINDYIASGEPMDKAGAYGIQGLGGDFVESYTGSLLNVIGLPMEKIEKVLNDNAWELRKKS